MSKDELNKRYFDWMYQLVCSDRYHRGLSYRKLLGYLYDTEFTYLIDLDGNRAEDGANLRYRFGHEHKYANPIIASYLDDQPCSVLEMMIALALRCEEQFMCDATYGDRTGQWFWGMIDNLGLDDMYDAAFDYTITDEVIFKFLNREHGSNGEGGLFYVERPRRDLRDVEIWYQMCWYLGEIL